MIGRRQVAALAAVTFFLALIALADKLKASPTYFDGTLEQNHQRLLAFQFTNNEQSRLLQFAVPELFVRLFGLTVPHAYMLQRWLFVWLALLLFYVYLRHWFRPGASLAGVCFLAAVLPLTQLSDLQEYAPFLMVSFLCGLWTIRAGRPLLCLLALLVGVLNNETTLILVVVWFLANCEGWRARQVWSAGWRTAAVGGPRGPRDRRRPLRHTRPATSRRRLAPARQPMGDRQRPTISTLLAAGHMAQRLPVVPDALRPVVGVCLSRLAPKPRFVRATLLMAPLFVVAHLITGIIAEPAPDGPAGLRPHSGGLFLALPRRNRRAHVARQPFAGLPTVSRNVGSSPRSAASPVGRRRGPR